MIVLIRFFLFDPRLLVFGLKFQIFGSPKVGVLVGKSKKMKSK